MNQTASRSPLLVGREDGCRWFLWPLAGATVCASIGLPVRNHNATCLRPEFMRDPSLAGVGARVS